MKKIITAVAVILTLYFIFFFKLGERSLWDPDEPRYAEAAREMIQTGDYITPRFNYELRFDKPPLVYWLIVLSYKVFGISEFSARLWPALFGLGSVILVYLLGDILKDKRLGLFSALILATSVEFAVLARVCTTDMALCFFITLALLLFLKEKLILSFAAMALATLTKGPVGVVLPILIIGAFILAAKERKSLSLKGLFLGGILFLALALPWYILIVARHGGAYVEKFFVFHHFQRFFSKEFHHAEPFYYYIPMLLGGFLPWSIFLPWSVYRRAATVRKKEPKWGIWLFILFWALIPVLFFSFAKAKLPTYILPIFPALAIIVGSFFEEAKLDRALFCVVVFVFISGIIALSWVVPKYDIERSGKIVAKTSASTAKPDDRFATYKFFKPSFVFYTQRKVVRLETQEDLFNFLSAAGRAFVFFKINDYEQIKDGVRGTALERAGRYVAITNSPQNRF